MAVTAGRGVATGRPVSDVPSGRNNADVSQREDLANFISMITRDETPFMSSIGKTKATAIFHEWQTDELAPPGSSRVGEGTDYIIPAGYAQANGATTGTGQTGTDLGGAGGEVAGGAFATTGPNRSRIGNYTQINGKTIAVSGTRRAIDQAGVADEYAYQLKKRGTELRRDVESDLVHAYNGAGTPTSGPRQMGGFQSWINSSRTCELNGITTVAPLNLGGTAVTASATNTGVGTHVPVLGADTNAGRQALSLTAIDSVMQKIYEEGGKASRIMLSPKLRRDFSDLMVTDSGVRRNIDMDGKLRQSVDVYMSDFGDLMVVPNYIMGLNNGVANGAAGNTADSCALVYDPQWFAMATLRPLHEVDVGQRGDSTIGMMVEEMTLEVKNPFGCGAIYNLR